MQLQLGGLDLDTRPNLTHPSRNSLPRTVPISSTSFTASPRVLPIPFFTDVPEFPSSKPGHDSLGAHTVLSGTMIRQRAEPGELRALDAGGLFELGKGRSLGRLGKFGPLQPPSRESAEGDPGAGVVEPASRSWLEMEFDSEALRRLLGKYKFRDLTVEELKNVNMFFPHFRYSMDTYVFKDSSQKDLLNFTGTIPVIYQGNTYNIPIRLWILDSHPFAPPICFLKPTANMGILVGKHVDAQGRIYLPYLQNWSHPKSVIVGLIKEMIAKFQEELPLYSLSSSDEARQVDLLAYIAKITEGVSDINSKNWANRENKTVNKITVVGGGELGIACTLAISAKGIADKLVLLDFSEGTKGGMMDLDIFNLPNVEISKDLSASAHSKVVIFTVNSLGSSQSYLDVVQSNVDMFRALVPALGHYSQHGILLVASQPVEIMTYVTWKLSAFPANRVIGIGCNLDSQRLQYIITNVLKAQTSGKEVWVIGEQGEDKVPIWSGQEEVTNHDSQMQLSNRAMELLRVKGQRSWSVGLSVADLLDSIVNDKKKVHSVSVLAKGYYDINSEVFLSLPCILGTSGVSEVIKTTVKEETVTGKLQSSASSIHGLQQQLKL